jgi:predicted lipoprotein with Yx(FWY)xxD motif
VFDPAGEAQRPAKVGVAEHPTLGMILVDGEGMTLYRFDNDTAGVSNCSGGCLTAWPPLLTEFEPVALEGVNGEIGTITRSDGTMQVTVNGFPLYYWQNDEAAGDANGQGVNNIWWVVDADGETVGN